LTRTEGRSLVRYIDNRQKAHIFKYGMNAVYKLSESLMLARKTIKAKILELRKGKKELLRFFGWQEYGGQFGKDV